MEYELVIKKLRSRANPKNVAGMARFGINPSKTLGVSVPYLRSLARHIGRDHALALRLWKSGIHEARILASMVADPQHMTPQRMDKWAEDFDSWDVCDQACGNVFDKTPYAYQKIRQWTKSSKEFVKRAGYAMIAVMVLRDKTAPDSVFINFFPLIATGSVDERNFVKKAVNWALRQVGKRNQALRKKTIVLAEQIAKKDSLAARWIAADAIRELKKKTFNK